jgi:phosphatidylglycerophosphate synthase
MWRTKPTDRFILRWIKLHLSAPLTARLAPLPWLRPLHFTVAATSLGCLAGILFALGKPWQAGCIAAAAQVLDGVDGQLARLTGRSSAAGAFWDSVLDRYADAALLGGMTIYLLRQPPGVPASLIVALGLLALVGGSQISYTTARAETLHLSLGPPTLASKGTRMSAMTLAAWSAPLWRGAPFVALAYLAAHTTCVVALRLARVARAGDPRRAPTGDPR